MSIFAKNAKKIIMRKRGVELKINPKILGLRWKGERIKFFMSVSGYKFLM